MNGGIVQNHGAQARRPRAGLRSEYVSGPDCVLVGFNETDLAEFLRTQQQFAQVSGGYRELRSNSVLIGDKRATYMELLNATLERMTGRPSELNGFATPSLGIAYLASYLIRRGFDVEFVNFFNTGRDTLEAMLSGSPGAVAITTTYYVSDEPIREIVRFIRERNPTVPIIVGGPRVNNVCMGLGRTRQDLLLRSIGADIYIHDAQGEATLAAVLGALRDEGGDLSRIPNLIYRRPGADNSSGPPGRNRAMLRTSRRPEHNDLNENAIDWSCLDPDFYAPTTYLRTSRSCSFNCAFCNYPAMAGPLSLVDLSVVEKELRYLSEHGVRNVVFVDDTFNVPLPRFKRLCKSIIADRLDLRWVSFFRCSNADDEAFDLMAESGCIGVFLGIESGDPTILKGMNKSARPERYAYGIEQLTSRGIATLASMVLGFPGETEATVRNSLDFINETRPTFYNMQLYYHDVLAPIEKRRDEYGLTGSGYSWQHRTMSWQEAVDRKDEFIRGVRGSALLPLYGLSIWSLPYLMSNGLTAEQVRAFAGGATELLIEGLDTDYVDPARATRQLADLIGSAGTGDPTSVERKGAAR